MVRKSRRNFFPTFIINSLLWVLVLLIIFKTLPDKNIILTLASLKLSIYPNIILLFLFLTLSLTLTLALVFGNTRRGFLMTIFFDGFLLLCLIKQVSWLNLLLLGAILSTLEIYFYQRKRLKVK